MSGLRKKAHVGLLREKMASVSEMYDVSWEGKIKRKRLIAFPMKQKLIDEGSRYNYVGNKHRFVLSPLSYVEY